MITGRCDELIQDPAFFFARRRRVPSANRVGEFRTRGRRHPAVHAASRVMEARSWHEGSRVTFRVRQRQRPVTSLASQCDTLVEWVQGRVRYELVARVSAAADFPSAARLSKLSAESGSAAHSAARARAVATSIRLSARTRVVASRRLDREHETRAAVSARGLTTAASGPTTEARELASRYPASRHARSAGAWISSTMR